MGSRWPFFMTEGYVEDVAAVFPRSRWISLPNSMSRAGLLFLALGWGCTRDSTGPVLAFCETDQGAGVVTFADANLEAAIRDELAVGSLVDLNCDLLERLT